jgi:hypothetical protein
VKNAALWAPLPCPSRSETCTRNGSGSGKTWWWSLCYLLLAPKSSQAFVKPSAREAMDLRAVLLSATRCPLHSALTEAWYFNALRYPSLPTTRFETFSSGNTSEGNSENEVMYHLNYVPLTQRTGWLARSSHADEYVGCANNHGIFSVIQYLHPCLETNSLPRLPARQQAVTRRMLMKRQPV